MPTLASMAGGPITTVAPTTTATALTSITTGLTPGRARLDRLPDRGRRRGAQRAALGRRRAGDARGPTRLARSSRSSRSSGRRARWSASPSSQTSASPRPTSGGDPVGWRAASSIAVQVALAARRRRAVRVRLLRRHRQGRPRARLRPVLRRRARERRPPGRRRAARRCRPARRCSSPPTTARSTSATARLPIAELLASVTAPVGRGPVPLAARPAGPPTTCCGGTRRATATSPGWSPTSRRSTSGGSARRGTRRCARASATSPWWPATGELPRPRRLRPVRAGLPARFADVGRGECPRSSGRSPERSAEQEPMSDTHESLQPDEITEGAVPVSADGADGPALPSSPTRRRSRRRPR